MTAPLHTIKLAPSTDCYTDSFDGAPICPIPGTIGSLTVGDCQPTLAKAAPDTFLAKLPGMCADPAFNKQAPSTLDQALAQMASRDALAPRIPDSFFDGAPQVDLAGLFLGAAILAGVAASGFALLLAKLRKKNLAKQEAAVV